MPGNAQARERWLRGIPLLNRANAVSVLAGRVSDPGCHESKRMSA